MCVCELVWPRSRDQTLQRSHREPHTPLQWSPAVLELAGVSSPLVPRPRGSVTLGPRGTLAVEELVPVAEEYGR